MVGCNLTVPAENTRIIDATSLLVMPGNYNNVFTNLFIIIYVLICHIATL